MLLSSCAGLDLSGEAISVYGASGDEIAAAARENNLNQLQAQREAVRQSIVSTESQRNSLVQRTTSATQFQNQVNALESRKSQCAGTSKQRNNCVNTLNKQIKNIQNNRNFRLAQRESQAAQQQITQLDAGLAELRNREAVADENINRINTENQARAAEEARQAAAAEAAKQAALEAAKTKTVSDEQVNNQPASNNKDIILIEDKPRKTDTNGNSPSKAGCMDTDYLDKFRKGYATDSQGNKYEDYCDSDWGNLVWDATCNEDGTVDFVGLSCDKDGSMLACSTGRCTMSPDEEAAIEVARLDGLIAAAENNICACEAYLKEENEYKLITNEQQPRTSMTTNQEFPDNFGVTYNVESFMYSESVETAIFISQDSTSFLGTVFIATARKQTMDPPPYYHSKYTGIGGGILRGKWFTDAQGICGRNVMYLPKPSACTNDNDCQTLCELQRNHLNTILDNIGYVDCYRYTGDALLDLYAGHGIGWYRTSPSKQSVRITGTCR